MTVIDPVPASSLSTDFTPLREQILSAAREFSGALEGSVADATAQLVPYRGVLAERLGDDLRLRSFAVVALGFERLLVRETP